jgi:glycosyltransferase involved in cell wall biosynthesis
MLSSEPASSLAASRFNQYSSAAYQLFDPDWYLERNPEIKDAGIDALTHYLQLGGFEGRDPNPLFDSDWYLRQYPDVARMGVNPMLHYLSYGVLEGRDPHPLFATEWYLKQNPDLADGINPLIHYITQGVMEGRRPSKLFQNGMELPVAGHAATVDVLCNRRRRSDSPRVSIVIPVFNEAAFIAECLDSVLGQTLTDIEIICVNDGSNDDSGAIIDAYYQKHDRITTIYIPNSVGAAIARNIGINCAQGEYLQFTDADDVLPATGIERLFSVAKTDNVEVVRGNLAVFSSNSKHITPNDSPLPRLNKADWTKTKELCVPFYHVTYLIARDLVVKNGLSYPDLIDGEDPVFIANVLVNAKRISTIPDTSHLWRNKGGSQRESLRHIVDFIRGAAMARNIMVEFDAKSWTEGYCPFLRARFDRLFLRNAPRTKLERAIIELALKESRIFSTPAL